MVMPSPNLALSIGIQPNGSDVNLDADIDNKTKIINVFEPENISAEFFNRNPGFLGSVYVPSNALELKKQLVFVDVYKTPLLFVETPPVTEISKFFQSFHTYLQMKLPSLSGNDQRQLVKGSVFHVF